MKVILDTVSENIDFDMNIYTSLHIRQQSKENRERLS